MASSNLPNSYTIDKDLSDLQKSFWEFGYLLTAVAVAAAAATANDNRRSHYLMHSVLPAMK